jgi:hypothetical protein
LLDGWHCFQLVRIREKTKRVSYKKRVVVCVLFLSIASLYTGDLLCRELAGWFIDNESLKLPYDII